MLIERQKKKTDGQTHSETNQVDSISRMSCKEVHIKLYIIPVVSPFMRRILGFCGGTVPFGFC